MENIQIFFDSNRGVYIPQNFAEEIKRESVEGVTAEDWESMEAGPDQGWYWETWERVLNNAIITDEKGIKWTLHHDGDLRVLNAVPQFYKRVSHHFYDLWEYLDTNSRTAAIILCLSELGKQIFGNSFVFDRL